MGWNQGRRGGKPATNRLSYGTANVLRLVASMSSSWPNGVWQPQKPLYLIEI
jgi:hypothetical protein